MQPILDKIKQLTVNGITAHTPTGIKNIKAVLLAGIFDLPAKASVLNTVQFNGKYGCNYCKDRGMNVNPGRHIYLPKDTHELRTELEMKQWASEAERDGEPVYGVKGLSVLSGVVNILFLVPIDYMHAVLEGIVKTLTKCWFTTNNLCKPYYLRPYISEIDKEISRIKPPHEFRRTPRSIESIKYWKASKYRAFLLFYSVPVLKNYLPPDYLYHLSIFVFAIHTLLSTSINPKDLPKVQQHLELFYSLIPELYGEHVCTANVHSAIHLVKFIKLWGPLWTHSTFGFENANGILKQQIHGTRNILLQTVFMMKLRQFFSLKKNLVEEETLHQIEDQTFIIGKVWRKELDEIYHHTVGASSAHVFGRVKLKGVIYHSKEHERLGKSRNSSVISFLENGKLQFGYILFFSLGGSPIALVEKFSIMDKGILDNLDPPELQQLLHQDIRTVLGNIIYQVKKLSVSKQLIALPNTSIVNKCVLIPVKGVEWNYVILQPNSIEHH